MPIKEKNDMNKDAFNERLEHVLKIVFGEFNVRMSKKYKNNRQMSAKNTYPATCISADR